MQKVEALLGDLVAGGDEAVRSAEQPIARLVHVLSVTGHLLCGPQHTAECVPELVIANVQKCEIDRPIDTYAKFDQSASGYPRTATGAGVTGEQQIAKIAACVSKIIGKSNQALGRHFGADRTDGFARRDTRCDPNGK